MSARAGKPRILVVEDHETLAEMIEARLRLDGMEPILCLSGADALGMVEREPLDAVILDIMMPEVDGYEVLRRIRSNPETEALPVILLTAKVRPVDVELGLSMGANAYITKPFSPHALVRRLRELLDDRAPAPRSERPDLTRV